MSIKIATGQRVSYPMIFDPIDTLDRVVPEAIGYSPSQIIAISDSNVVEIYGKRITGIMAPVCAFSLITIPAGEASKSPETLGYLYDKILGMQIDRKTPIIAFGGGVVGDLAGYAAATTLRGLPLIHVPTTLTAQVDSSIGGKTGINHSLGKNLIGAFYPPRAILCDTSLLQALPRREWMSGLAEVVKHACLVGRDHYSWVSTRWNDIVRNQSSDIDRLVEQSAHVKAGIVEEDEKESGMRMWLNLGHTTGHAIERATGYGQFLHGEAVACGMAVAIELSRLRSFEVDRSLVYKLLESMNINERIRDLDPEVIFSATVTDKKRQGGTVPFVLLEQIGKPFLDSEIGKADFRLAWTEMLDHIQ
ncbi:MAG: 3-dehydroquinate synthase [Rhodothermales bacterium]|nr:3-dehydroquinate synthase [Rhodothermales bacterium]